MMQKQTETIIDEEPVMNPLEKESPEVTQKKNPMVFIIPGLILLLIIGFFVVRGLVAKTGEKKVVEEETIEEILVPVDASVEVDLKKSTSEANSVVITVKGLGGKYVSIGYELQYESGGVGKGVTSGSKPLDVTGQDAFERVIYLGTCSRNVCKPDLGITKVALVLEFTDKDNKKSQFSKEYEL